MKKPIKELFDLLDSDAEISKETLLSVAATYYSCDATIGAQKTCAELADEDTDPGHPLLVEFVWGNFLSRDSLNPEEFDVAVSRHAKFVTLLESLKISTRYDCCDSYGSCDEDPRIASLELLFFENDDKDGETARFAKATKLYSDEEIAEYA